ncbi:MAG TPA: alpha/beta hydrolase-fold protein [Streptosporangiaceae bacterium]|nr:alpha/beta hydrolase-fold protein [Streptosporangiaceae bacterium]
MDGSSPGQDIGSGPAHSPSLRWLAVALAGAVFAVLAAGGMVGAGRYVTNFWLYRGFAPPSAPHSVLVEGPGGPRRVPVVRPAVQSITVVSRAVGEYADPVYVVLPPGYAAHPRQRYPVLYLLHGFPGQPWGFLNIGRIAAIEAVLVAARQLKPMILVMPTGTRSFLTDQEWANGVRPGNAWETFVAHDLVTAIDSRYRTIASPAARGLAGLSEGGYGALNIGLHHPGEFSLLESWSGYMRAGQIAAIFGRSPRALAYNSPAVSVTSVAAQLRAGHTYIWFYIGSEDSLAAQNRAFATELTTLGVAHHFFERPGAHSWRLWRSQMAQALLTASGHLGHA